MKLTKKSNINNTNKIKHNTINNNKSIQDEKQYNYIINETKIKPLFNQKSKGHKTKKDYTSILNYNYIWLKEERKSAFKQGKGYGAGTIKEEVTACISLLTVKPLIFIDIGAHIGDYTREVLRRYPTINALLFEPSSANKPILEKEYSQLPNVMVNSCALSNTNGKQNIYFDKAGSVLASLNNRRVEHFNIDMSNHEEVVIKRFDTFWKTTNYKDTTIIDYVKIDVEGYELFVLHGFGDLIYNMRVIQFEFGGANIDTRTFFQDFWYFFKEHKFALYRITPIGNLPIRQYAEIDEYFSTTNYIAVNKKFNEIEIIDNYKANTDKPIFKSKKQNKHKKHKYKQHK